MRECKYCFKPISFMYATICRKCSAKIKKDGFTHYRVRFGEVGKDTINYQQHLHRKFFNCNVHIDYRGIKENRVYNSLEPSSLRSLEHKFHSVLKCNLTINLTWLYLECCKKKNFTRRLLYNSSLYFIHYHITNPDKYESEDHFRASLLNSIINHILKTFVRINKEEYKTSKTLQLKLSIAKQERNELSYKKYNNILSSVSELCGEVVSSV